MAFSRAWWISGTSGTNGLLTLPSKALHESLSAYEPVDRATVLRTIGTLAIENALELASGT